MTVLKRDTHYHTYSDYLTWSRDYGDELINGTAYVREPPSPSWSHQLEAGNYGRATPLELKGRTQLTAVPGVTIDWARVLAKMS
jgi:hypothetical protein